LEHIGKFIIQHGEASSSSSHVFNLRLFPLSLLGVAFTFFISLSPNYLDNWPKLEQKLYEYLFTNETRLMLSIIS
jgi:hypothetical protein